MNGAPVLSAEFYCCLLPVACSLFCTSCRLMELGLAKKGLFVSDCCLLPVACCLFDVLNGAQRLNRLNDLNKSYLR
jgi:hypothetical protein